MKPRCLCLAQRQVTVQGPLCFPRLSSSPPAPAVPSPHSTVFTNLERFNIGFESLAFRPDRKSRSLPPLRRVVLPALTSLKFHGASKYFEDLVARVDTPTISFVKAEFFTPELFQFIGHTPMPVSFKYAVLSFVDKCAHINIGYRDPPGGRKFRIVLSVLISCGALDWKVACLAQICSNLSPFFSNVERLRVTDTDYEGTTVQYMSITPKLREVIASVLQELSRERAEEVLPMLCHLYLVNSPNTASIQQAIEPVISSCQLSDHP